MEDRVIVSGNGKPQPAPAKFRREHTSHMANAGAPVRSMRSDFEPEKLFERACRSAIDAGGQMLFELPGALFGDGNARAAALRYGPAGEELCFVVQRQCAPHIRIVSGEQAPRKVAEFVMAYADVLQLIANDQGITGRLPH